MSVWDISPSGVRGVLSTTQGVAAGFEGLTTAMNVDLAGGAAQAASGPIEQALTGWLDGQRPNIEFVFIRTGACINGAAQATNAYVDGDLEMAANVQTSAAAAPDPQGDHAGWWGAGAPVIVPDSIPQIHGDLDMLAGHARGLQGTGAGFADTGARVHATWQGLASHSVAPEGEQLFAATEPVSAVSASLGADLTSIGAALAGYAERCGRSRPGWRRCRARRGSSSRRSPRTAAGARTAPGSISTTGC